MSMGKTVQGVWNGTGAACVVCIGFIPDWVELINPEDGIVGATLKWDRWMRAAETTDGILNEADGTAHVAQTAGNAIRPYFGGDTMDTTLQTDVTYGGGVYLGFDPVGDYRYLSSDPGPFARGDATTATINSWTLGNSGNRTGNFNSDVDGTYIGEGSKITIDGRTYFIEALTATQGSAANEVTLSYAAATGAVERITGMQSMIPIPIGTVAPAGFHCARTTLINDNDETVFFRAGTYDTVR